LRVPRDVWLLGAISLINDVSSEGIFAVLPYYLTSLGGGPALVGTTWGGMELVKSVLNVASGRLFREPGRAKPAVALGYAVSAVAKLILSLVREPNTAAVVASLERVGKGVRTPPRDAILAGLAGDEPGLVFGIHRTMDTLGAILGALLAALLLTEGVEPRAAIAVFAVLGFLALLPLLPVEEKLPEEDERKPSRPMKRTLAVVTVYRLGAAGWMLYSLGVLGEKGPVAAALAYAGFSTLHALTSVPAGRLSDVIGPGRTLSLGYGGTALAAAVTALGHPWAGFLIYGASFGVVDAVERAAVAGASGDPTSYGSYHATVGIASLVCGLAVGWLWEYLSPTIAFLYSAVLTAVAALIAPPILG